MAATWSSWHAEFSAFFVTKSRKLVSKSYLGLSSVELKPIIGYNNKSYAGVLLIVWRLKSVQLEQTKNLIKRILMVKHPNKGIREDRACPTELPL